MEIQDFGHVHFLVHNRTRRPTRLTSRPGLVVNDNGKSCIPCSHAMMVLRDEELQREEYCDNYFLSDNFRITYGELFFPIAV